MKMKYALCAMLACFASPVALGQTVSVNYNHSQDFTGYHPYIWAINNIEQILGMEKRIKSHFKPETYLYYKA